MAASRSLILIALAVLSLSAVASAHNNGRRRIATIHVQGTISCLNSKNTTAIIGATARVECKTLTEPVKPFKKLSTKTDKHGFYLISFPAIVNGTRLGHCNASLNSSPLPKCNVTSNINGGVKGSPLIRFRQLRGGDRIYSVKPFFYTVKSNATHV